MKVKRRMDNLLVVLLTALITVILVLLVQTFFYLLLRTAGFDLQLTRQLCPGRRISQAEERCSNPAVAAATSVPGEKNDVEANGDVVIGQSDEPQVDIICETATNDVTCTNAAAAAAAAVDDDDDDDDDANNEDDDGVTDRGRTVVNIDETVIKTRTSQDSNQQQPSPARPCSCWTTVSSDIRYENEQDGLIVYRAKMIVPSSCCMAHHWHVPESRRSSDQHAYCATSSCLAKADVITPDSKTPGDGGKNLKEEAVRCATFAQDMPVHNQPTQNAQSQDKPWQRESYNQYIARSSVFSDVTDRSSSQSPVDVAKDDLQTVKFQGAVRSCHGPAGCLTVSPITTRL